MIWAFYFNSLSVYRHIIIIIPFNEDNRILLDLLFILNCQLSQFNCPHECFFLLTCDKLQSKGTFVVIVFYTFSNINKTKEVHDKSLEDCGLIDQVERSSKRWV